jgi:hypothetical protein
MVAVLPDEEEFNVIAEFGFGFADLEIRNHIPIVIGTAIRNIK